MRHFIGRVDIASGNVKTLTPENTKTLWPYL